MSLAGGHPAPSSRIATYRLQLRAGFGFREVAALVPYLRALGISHVYLSPCFQAAAGSTHGYDVVDPTRLSDELGGEAGWLILHEALLAHGMQVLLDIVPNHMSTADPRNRWWWDLLADGRSSPWAAVFDIDWEPHAERMTDRVLLPVLPDHLGRVIESGAIHLVREGGSLLVAHHADRFPLRVETVVALVAEAVADGAPSLVAGADTLTPATDEASRRQRLSERLDLLAEVARVLDAPATAAAVDRHLATVNGDVARLGTLLEDQHHRLARWQTGVEEVNYRRFFDISTLAAVRVDAPAVLAEVMATAVAMVRSGQVDGLRVDHVDGLSRPLRFATDLRAATGADAWLLAEKILDADEELPRWALDGTSGYDFLGAVNGLFVDAGGLSVINAFFNDVRGSDESFATTALSCKREVLTTTLVSDVERVVALLATVTTGSPVHSDFTRSELAAAVVEIVAAMPVYRTYVDPAQRPAAAADVARVWDVVARVAGSAPQVDGRLVHTIASLVARGVAADIDTDDPGVRAAVDELVLRLQQLCATAMAKGVEDRAFYRQVALVSCNDVGTSPARPTTDLDAFHVHNQRVQRERPRTLLTTSTHDTKRSEDVRARLHLLSERPADWVAAVHRWRDLARVHRGSWDDPVMEYLLYQVLVGAHPLDAGRARAYMEKAAREASTRTGWFDPDDAYETGLGSFVDGVCGDRRLTDEVAAFVRSLAPHDRVVSLAATLLRLTSPGIPDTYRGTELWDHSLVDPDNRRAVDWDLRRSLLATCEGRTVADTWAGDDPHGAVRLALVRDVLAVRRRRPEAFDERGAYIPMHASGTFADDVVAFTRGEGGDVLTVAVRGPLRRRGTWGDTAMTLPTGRWRNLCDDAAHRGVVALAGLLHRAPVALLEREG